MAILVKRELDFGNGLSIPQVYIKYKKLSIEGSSTIALEVDLYVSKEASYNGVKPFMTEKKTFDVKGLDMNINIWGFIYHLVKLSYPDSEDILIDETSSDIVITSCEQIDQDIHITGTCDKDTEVIIFCYGYKVASFSASEKFDYVIKNSVSDYRYSLRKLCFKSKTKNKKISGVTISEVENFNDPEYIAHEEALGGKFDMDIV